MKVHQKVLWAVGLVALGAFSLAGFLSDVGLIPRMTVYRALTRMWYELSITITAGAVFLFLLALSIYLPISTWLRGRGRGRGGVITVSNPLGPVELSTEAVSKFIQRLGEEMQGVEGVRVRVEAQAEGVECYVTLAAHSEVEGGIPKLTKDFQEFVKKNLLEIVGVSDVKKVEVKITKILPEGEKAK